MVDADEASHAELPGSPIVIESQELDHVTDVRLVLDPPRRRALAAREDGMMDDPALLEELRPDLLREGEMGGVVAVQVADLAPADPEGELPASPDAGLYSRPGSDLIGDPFAGG